MSIYRGMNKQIVVPTVKKYHSTIKRDELWIHADMGVSK